MRMPFCPSDKLRAWKWGRCVFTRRVDVVLRVLVLVTHGSLGGDEVMAGYLSNRMRCVAKSVGANCLFVVLSDTQDVSVRVEIVVWEIQKRMVVYMRRKRGNLKAKSEENEDTVFFLFQVEEKRTNEQIEWISNYKRKIYTKKRQWIWEVRPSYGQTEAAFLNSC